MGLGVYVRAPLPRPAGRPMKRTACFEMLRSAIAAVRTPAGGPPHEFYEHEHELGVMIHSLTEPLRFNWSPDGRIIGDTKTSTLGPGYHAWVVQVLREIGKTCGFEWNWAADETAFARDGNFEALQEAMADQLSAMAVMFLKPREGEPSEHWGVNMGLGFSPVRPPGEFSHTPLGPRSREWWERAATDEGLADACRDFYIWWEREPGAEYWRKLAEGLMWTEVPWHPPEKEEEELLCRTVLDAASRAEELDPDAWLPPADLDELRQMLEADEEQPPPMPRPEGLGYLRGPVRRTAPGDWTLEVPGYFYTEWNQDEGQLTFHHGNRAIHISTYRARPEDGPPAPHAEVAADFEPDPQGFGAGGVESLSESTSTTSSRAIVGAYEEDEFEGWCLQGCAAVDGECACITVVYTEESDRAWAEQIWRSLAYCGRGDAPDHEASGIA